MRTHPDSGRIYLRDAIHLAFFLPAPIHDRVEGIGDALTLYLATIPSDALTWCSIGANSEEWSPLDASTISRCRLQLRPSAARARPLTAFELGDGQVGGDAPGYSFSMLGSPYQPEWPDTLGVIQMSFPMEVLTRETADDHVAFARAIAASVSPVSGYMSPCLEWAELHRSIAASQSKAIALRHPGYDVQLNELTRTRLGHRIRGARWLTFLGPDLAAVMGGASALRSTFSPGIGVERLDSGVMIRAGDLPEIGDRNVGTDVPLLREVATVLEPVTAFDDIVLRGNFAGHDAAFLREWERRLLADSSA
jgi:hypothetical protein